MKNGLRSTGSDSARLAWGDEGRLSDYVYGYELGVEAVLRLTAIGITDAVVGLGLARLLPSQLIFLRVFDGAASATGVLLVLSIAIAFTTRFRALTSTLLEELCSAVGAPGN